MNTQSTALNRTSTIISHLTDSKRKRIYRRSIPDKLFPNVTNKENTIEANFTPLDCQTFHWLSLPFYHPVYIQMFSFYSSAYLLSKILDLPTALVEFEYSLNYLTSAPPVKIVLHHPKKVSETKYCAVKEGYDFSNKQMFKFISHFVNFDSNRILAVKKKREEKKSNLIKVKDEEFEFANPFEVGCSNQAEVYISIVKEDDTACGLVSLQRGLEENPYIYGSGDHVNTGHSIDAMFQFCRCVIYKYQIVPMGTPLTIVKGICRFPKYLELSFKFDIKLLSMSCIPSSFMDEIERIPGPLLYMKLHVQVLQGDQVGAELVATICPVFHVVLEEHILSDIKIIK